MTTKKEMGTQEGSFFEKNGTKLSYFERNKGLKSPDLDPTS
jgi:hypothetical protein